MNDIRSRRREWVFSHWMTMISGMLISFGLALYLPAIAQVAPPPAGVSKPAVGPTAVNSSVDGNGIGVTEEKIPFKRDQVLPESSGNDGSVWVALIFVGLTLGAFLYWRRNSGALINHTAAPTTGLSGVGNWPWGLPKSTAAIRVGKSSRLTAKHSLHEVEWKGRHLLVGCGENTISLIVEVGGDQAPADGSSGGPVGHKSAVKADGGGGVL